MPLSEIQWDAVDVSCLQALRQRFLDEDFSGDYWSSDEILFSYDQTFARRISWKWRAVLKEIEASQSFPASIDLLDWACGTGIAARTFMDAFPFRVKSIVYYDRSIRACQFAQRTTVTEFPEVKISSIDAGQIIEAAKGRWLLLSHLVNEIDQESRMLLDSCIAVCAGFIWVEPGTYAASRCLMDAHERFLGSFDPIAPCTHSLGCGMLADGMHMHWCHFFADSPVEAFTDGHWTRFGQMMGIDLRRLPYSYLVMRRQDYSLKNESLTGVSRLIGEPRVYKGFLRMLTCRACGVAELMYQKRTNPTLFRALSKHKAGTLFEWIESDDRITSGRAHCDLLTED
jgi:ribosomal protein RSM22 (predicted rRNA methylase)